MEDVLKGGSPDKVGEWHELHAIDVERWNPVNDEGL